MEDLPHEFHVYEVVRPTRVFEGPSHRWVSGGRSVLALTTND